MKTTLRLIEASEPVSCFEEAALPVDAMAARHDLREAEMRLVAVHAQVDELRRVGRDDVAQRMEQGALAAAFEAFEAAERRLLAAPVRSLEDLAMKIILAAEAEFECGETNEALRAEAEAILRGADRARSAIRPE